MIPLLATASWAAPKYRDSTVGSPGGATPWPRGKEADFASHISALDQQIPQVAATIPEARTADAGASPDPVAEGDWLADEPSEQESGRAETEPDSVILQTASVSLRTGMADEALADAESVENDAQVWESPIANAIATPTAIAFATHGGDVAVLVERDVPLAPTPTAAADPGVVTARHVPDAKRPLPVGIAKAVDARTATTPSADPTPALDTRSRDIAQIPTSPAGLPLQQESAVGGEAQKKDTAFPQSADKVDTAIRADHAKGSTGVVPLAPTAVTVAFPTSDTSGLNPPEEKPLFGHTPKPVADGTKEVSRANFPGGGTLGPEESETASSLGASLPGPAMSRLVDTRRQSVSEAAPGGTNVMASSAPDLLAAVSGLVTPSPKPDVLWREQWDGTLRPGTAAVPGEVQRDQFFASPLAQPDAPKLEAGKGVLTPIAPASGAEAQANALMSLQAPAATALGPQGTTSAPIATFGPSGAQIAAGAAGQMALAVMSVGPGTTEIALSPVELGRVRLSLSATDAAISVAILAERPETADLMRRHIGALEQEFRSMGYYDVTFSFGSGRREEQRHPAYSSPASSKTVDFVPSVTAVPERVVTTGLDLRL